MSRAGANVSAEASACRTQLDALNDRRTAQTGSSGRGLGLDELRARVAELREAVPKLRAERAARPSADSADLEARLAQFERFGLEFASAEDGAKAARV